MKKLIVLTFALCLLATSAHSAELGLRAGGTIDPDQFHVGAHINLGHVLPPLRLVPNLEVGFGDNHTVWAFNGDLIYDFKNSPFGAGGELGLNVINHSGHGSDTHLGFSLLGDYTLAFNNGNSLLLEIKFGVLDAPDFKATVGYTFF